MALPRHKPLRPAQLPPRPRAAGARRCEAEGCSAATALLKPYCSQHFKQMPYVASVEAYLRTNPDARGGASNDDTD